MEKECKEHEDARILYKGEFCPICLARVELMMRLDEVMDILREEMDKVADA